MGCNQGKTSAPGLRRAPTAPLAKSADSKEAKTLLNQAPLMPKSVSFVAVAAGNEEKPASQGIFDGAWSNGSISYIRNDRLTWSDGQISQIEVDVVTRKMSVSYQGNTYRGELRSDDDKIHWDDGDIWTRHEACPVGLEPAKAGMVDTETEVTDPQNEAETAPEPLRVPALIEEEKFPSLAEEEGEPLAQAHRFPETVAPAPPPRSEPEADVRTPRQVEALLMPPAVHTTDIHVWAGQVEAILTPPAVQASDDPRPHPKKTTSPPGSSDKRLQHSASHSGSEISDTKPARKERNNCCC